MNKLSTLLLTALLILNNAPIFGQMYDFEDAIIPNLWEGDRTNFIVSNTNQLQLNAPAGSTASTLFWPCINADNCSWEFYLKYAFAASTSNYATFYLFSTETDFTSATNVSYYLKVGGAAGTIDKIELIYQQGSTKQVVLESHTGIVGGSQVSCRIQVSKNAIGIWELKTDTTGFFNYIKESSAQHWVKNPFKYSGIRCLYSSTRRDKFYFDDIVIREPFVVQNYVFENDSILKIYFNQPISSSGESAVTMNFNKPYTLVYGNNHLIICFQTPLPAGSYRGTISNIFSSSGDSLANTSLEIIKEVTYYVGQIRISEWMSDPSPTYGLPEIEWVELVNMSDEPIDLSKISLSDPSSKVKLATYSLKPDSVVIVCALNGCKYFSKQNCIEVNSLPSLNNSSDSIFIWANDTLLIDFIYYDISALPADFRRDGGYSMVRKEYPDACFFSQSIDFAQDNVGGSPGTISELKVNNTLMIQALVLSATEVTIKTNARIFIDGSSFYATNNIRLAVNTGHRYETSYTCHLNSELQPGYAYHFHVDSIRTCRNQTKPIAAEIEVIYPKNIQKNELFINEILYNPNSGGVDFVELYNSTSQYIQLKNSHFYNQTKNSLQHYFLSESKIIKPFDFIVLTSDSAILKRQYNTTVTENVFQAAHFLSLPDAGGKLIWIDQNADTLDQANYGDAYQNPLHRDTEGFSLEKIQSSEPNFYSANWTTSATFATPGYLNSQHAQMQNNQQKPFYCSPCHVTTNLNGINDYAMLYLSESTQGCFGSISIYRVSGEKIVDLIVNQSLGTTNAFQWNGQQQGGSLLEDGIYVAVAEWWSSDGQTHTSKIAISTSQY